MIDKTASPSEVIEVNLFVVDPDLLTGIKATVVGLQVDTSDPSNLLDGHKHIVLLYPRHSLDQIVQFIWETLDRMPRQILGYIGSVDLSRTGSKARYAVDPVFQQEPLDEGYSSEGR